MSKKTVRKAPGSQSTSQRKTKGLIAKDQNAAQSVQDPCVLDNRSHASRAAGGTDRCLPVAALMFEASQPLSVTGEGPRATASERQARCYVACSLSQVGRFDAAR